MIRRLGNQRRERGRKGERKKDRKREIEGEEDKNSNDQRNISIYVYCLL